jgi:hypothetical protein
MGGRMADFNEVFNRVFTPSVKDEYDENLKQLPFQNHALQRSRKCWKSMRQLGFTNSEFLTYIKFSLCEEVWRAIAGNKINYQPLAESMFIFALVNSSDHCIYLLNSTLKVEGGQNLTEGAIEKANGFNGDELLVRFGMAKIIYYDLSSRYLSV